MSPSRPLRASVVEAGARAWMAYEGDDWDAMGPKPQQAICEATEVIVDAILDALEARSDEWTDAAYPNSHPALHTVRSMTARKFLAVLRPDAP